MGCDCSEGIIEFTGTLHREPSHFHRCPECGEDTNGFREECREPKSRLCSKCLAKKFDARRGEAPTGHDCAYISWRRSLIPEAERRANAVAKKSSPQWAMEFHRGMDELVKLRANA